MKLAITSKTASCLVLKWCILRVWGQWLRVCRNVCFSLYKVWQALEKFSVLLHLARLAL